MSLERHGCKLQLQWLVEMYNPKAVIVVLHTTRWCRLSRILWRTESKLQSESSRLKKAGFILCVNMPTEEALYSKAASSFVQGIYHNFTHSTLTHWCRVWISTDIRVWWEALGLTGRSEATPSTHMSSNITSRFPPGFRPVSLQVRALSQSCRRRQDVIEVSTKAVKCGEKNKKADHFARLLSFIMLRKWCQKFRTQFSRK